MNGTQFSLKDFENFSKIHSILKLISPPYHLRSNVRFIDVIKREIKKSSGNETMNEELQKFLPIYHIKPDVNDSSGMTPAKLLFATKIRSVLDKKKDSQKRK